MTHLLRALREVGAAPIERPDDAALAAAVASAARPWPQPMEIPAARKKARTSGAGVSALGSASAVPPPVPPPLWDPPPVFPPLPTSSSAASSDAAATGAGADAAPPSSAPIPKAIVYSSFPTHLHVLDLALTGARVPFATLRRMGYTRADKEAALASFRADPMTRVLLLDRAGAEGLDLSFATFVFLAEPAADNSLEEQVVSRAHRSAL